MTSKKIAATLGTGTLGAGGAAGTVAWKVGLFDRSQNEVSETAREPSLEVEPPSSDPNSLQSPGGGTRDDSSVPKVYFANATSYDKKAVDSSNWELVKGEGKDGVTIKVEDGGDVWQCTIKGVVFDNNRNKRQSINGQVEEFVNKIRVDEEKRKKFVEKCAKSRINAEKSAGGKDSTIELEVEDVGGSAKLKNLDNLLEESFEGLKRVEGEYVIDYDNVEDWVLAVKKEGEENKRIIVKLKKDDGNEFCSIYGDLEGTEFDEGKFDILGEIFKGKSLGEGQSDDEKLTNFEKRKFLLRNCLKNNKEIKGLKVVSYTKEAEKRWKFENLDEKLLTKLYDNPSQ